MKKARTISGETALKRCLCGCGAAVTARRVFLNKTHQLDWMSRGGARELNALQPAEAKARGGHTAGTEAQATGRLAEAGRKGGRRAKEIAASFRASRAD